MAVTAAKRRPSTTGNVRRSTNTGADKRSQDESGRARDEPLVASYRPDISNRRRTHRGRFSGYGPLVYLVPVLAIISIIVVVDVARGPKTHSPDQSAAQPAAEAGDAPAVSNPGGPTVQADGAPTDRRPAVPAAELPAGGPFATKGAKSFHVVPGTSDQVGQGELTTYTIEVEDGITFTDGDTAFAAAVQATLSHPKSWTGSGETALRRVDTGTPDLRVTLAAQDTARSMCGFNIGYDTSCFLGATPGHVVLNVARWERGAHSFQGDIGQYRRYLVNHEVGHYFNNPHKPCSTNDGLAPLMMQQTLTTANNELADLVSDVQNDLAIPRDGKVCKPNEWAFPHMP